MAVLQPKRGSDREAVENYRERTTTGVVGANKLYNNSWKFCHAGSRLTKRTGENRA
jgi:hypothetical protein